MARKVNIGKINARVNRIRRALPAGVAIDTLKHTKDSFRNQGFTDATLRPWAPRKRGNRADARTKKRRAILVDTGALRASLSIAERSFKRVRVGSYGIPYATAHNKGVPSRDLPKRQFVGRSTVLRRKIRERIRNLVDKAFTK